MRVEGGDSQGNDWFRAGYSYDVGWSFNPPASFNKPSDFCALEMEAHAKFDVPIRVFEQDVPVIKIEQVADVKRPNGIVSTFQVLGVDLYTLPSAKWTWERSVSKGVDSPKASTTFTILSVPVTIQGWASLELGATLNVTAQAQASLDCASDETAAIKAAVTLTPFANLYGHATVGLGVPGLQAGVKGDLLLVGASLPISGGPTVAFNGTTKSLDLVLKASADLELRTLDGTLSLFAEAGPFVEEYPLVEWSGLGFTFPLWQFEKTYATNIFKQVTSAF